MIKDVLKVKLDKTLCDNLINSTILTAMLYSRETSGTTKEEQRLIRTQRAMERSMQGTSLYENI